MIGFVFDTIGAMVKLVIIVALVLATTIVTLSYLEGQGIHLQF